MIIILRKIINIFYQKTGILILKMEILVIRYFIMMHLQINIMVGEETQQENFQYCLIINLKLLEYTVLGKYIFIVQRHLTGL